MRPVSLLIFVEAQPVLGVDRIILAGRHQVLDAARLSGRRIAQIAPRPRELPFQAFAQMRRDFFVIPGAGKLDKTSLIVLAPLFFPDSQALLQRSALEGLPPWGARLAPGGRFAGVRRARRFALRWTLRRPGFLLRHVQRRSLRLRFLRP